MDFNNSNNNFQPLNLNKSDILDLTKHYPSLKKVILAAGWDANNVGSDTYDLDISAFLLDERGRVRNPKEHVCFFNEKNIKGVCLEEDNLSGAGDGDDERIHIDLESIDPSVSRILFNINIFNAKRKKQTFGMVQNSYVRLLDENDGEKELCRYELKENASTCTAVIFAQLVRNSNGWSFEAIGNGVTVDSLNDLLISYM